MGWHEGMLLHFFTSYLTHIEDERSRTTRPGTREGMADRWSGRRQRSARPPGRAGETLTMLVRDPIDDIIVSGTAAAEVSPGPLRAVTLTPEQGARSGRWSLTVSRQGGEATVYFVVGPRSLVGMTRFDLRVAVAARLDTTIVSTVDDYQDGAVRPDP
ncbi:MAG: hypothetical protein M5T61_09815 [Acidimicrobiia bacterium]|nr:hypothetical protein [Acidimicrobiia bacterium]